MSRVVMILGAGASAHTGAPLMGGFLDRAAELFRKGECGEFEGDFRLVFEAIGDLQIVHSKADLDLYDLETVFSTFEMAKIINYTPPSNTWKATDILESFRRVIIRTLEQSMLFPSHEQRPRPSELYERFGRLIRHLTDSGTTCTVMTFNYDIGVDFGLAHALQGRVLYPLGAAPQDRKDPQHVYLCKLHGSLNWLLAADGEAITSVLFDRQSVWESGKDGFRSRVGQRISLGQESNGQPASVVIVPPTWNKASYHNSLSGVWRRAALEMSSAEEIYISGFSIPETDSFFRYLYALGTAGPNPLRTFKVFDIDKSGGVKGRFEKLLGTGVANRFNYYGASGFDHLISMVGSNYDFVP